MKKLMTILILIIILLLTGSAGVTGQTPYDSFAPEAWRPMLGDDATLTIDVRNESETDSVVEFVVVDISTRQVLLVNSSNQVLAVMQVEEDDVKWISVDPLADKYIWTSPYAYCAWNPLKYIDPNGEKIGIRGDDGVVYVYQDIEGKTGFYHNGTRLDTDYANQATEAIDKIKEAGLYGRTMVEFLMKNNKLALLRNDGKRNSTTSGGRFVTWNPSIIEGGLDYNGNRNRPPFIGLAHEFAHVLSWWGGFMDSDIWIISPHESADKDEQWATYMENLIRMEHGIIVRKYYKYDPISECGIGQLWGIRGPLFPAQYANFVRIYMSINKPF